MMVEISENSPSKDNEMAARVAMWQTCVQSADSTKVQRDRFNWWMTVVFTAVGSSLVALYGELSPLILVGISIALLVVGIYWFSMMLFYGIDIASRDRIIRDMEVYLLSQPFTKLTELSEIHTLTREMLLQMLFPLVTCCAIALVVGLFLQRLIFS